MCSEFNTISRLYALDNFPIEVSTQGSFQEWNQLDRARTNGWRSDWWHPILRSLCLSCIRMAKVWKRSWKSEWHDYPYGEPQEVWLPNTNNARGGNSLRKKSFSFLTEFSIGHLAPVGVSVIKNVVPKNFWIFPRKTWSPFSEIDFPVPILTSRS